MVDFVGIGVTRELDCSSCGINGSGRHVPRMTPETERRNSPFLERTSHLRLKLAAPISIIISKSSLHNQSTGGWLQKVLRRPRTHRATGLDLFSCKARQSLARVQIETAWPALQPKTNETGLFGHIMLNPRVRPSDAHMNAWFASHRATSGLCDVPSEPISKKG